MISIEVWAESRQSLSIGNDIEGPGSSWFGKVHHNIDSDFIRPFSSGFKRGDSWSALGVEDEVKTWLNRRVHVESFKSEHLGPFGYHGIEYRVQPRPSD